MTELSDVITLSADVLGDGERGSYLLLVNLPEEQTITVGRRNTCYFPRGCYVYVGSALNGLRARLNRHLRDDKKLHWHIDYLLQKASITSIITCEAEGRIECALAQALSHRFDSIPGFGSSDCRCRSHLFLDIDGMKDEAMVILDRLGLKPNLVLDSKLAVSLKATG